jgi:hypothetical protein
MRWRDIRRSDNIEDRRGMSIPRGVRIGGAGGLGAVGSSEDYEAAARDAFARLSPEERAEFARYLRERASQRRVNIPGPAPSQGGSEDPGWLAKTTRELHEQPGQLRALLGEGTGSGASGAGSLGSLFASPLAKAALAGITAMVVKRMMRPT